MTHSEAEFLRQLLAQHDSTSHQPVQEFDLNKPPVPPYVHQQWPTLLYAWDDEYQRVKYLRALSQQELDDAVAKGWSEAPISGPPEEAELDPAATAEAQALDDKIAAAKKAKSARK